MLDRERILARLDDLEGYLKELRQIALGSFEEYRSCRFFGSPLTECTSPGYRICGPAISLSEPCEDVSPQERAFGCSDARECLVEGKP